MSLRLLINVRPHNSPRSSFSGTKCPQTLPLSDNISLCDSADVKKCENAAGPHNLRPRPCRRPAAARLMVPMREEIRRTLINTLLQQGERVQNLGPTVSTVFLVPREALKVRKFQLTLTLPVIYGNPR